MAPKPHSCRETQFPPPPVAKKVPFTATAHGVTLQDPYRWMSNTDDPDFISYLNEENSYADAFMRETLELQNTLYSEMVSRFPTEITTPPQLRGPWLYYRHTPEGKEYPIFCRKSAVESTGSEQVLLDWNDIAEKHGGVYVDKCRVSPDHRFLAYTFDTKGDEQFQLHIKDLASDSVLPQHTVAGVNNVAWAEDSSTLFYTLLNQNLRPYRLLCTELGSHSRDDAVIMTEDDSDFLLDIYSTKDGKFIIVTSFASTGNEERTTVWFMNSTNPHGGLQRFCHRVSGVRYKLEHHRGIFYVITNAPTSKDKKISGNWYLARCTAENAQLANLKVFFMPNDDIRLLNMYIFNEHLVLSLTIKGFDSPCSINMPIDFDGETKTEIDDFNPWFFPLPSIDYDICEFKPAPNDNFMTTVYRVVMSSLVMPNLTVDYDMSRRTFSIAHQEDVGNISAVDVQGNGSAGLKEWKDGRISMRDVGTKDYSEKYLSKRKDVISHDGVRIPMRIFYCPAAYRAGESPGLLYGYGAYGTRLEKNWSPDWLSLLDRGWLLAFAIVRGGRGPVGSWHESGCGSNKLNSMKDFVSCAQFLINDGLIHKDRLIARGRSAGGLLVGAVVNMHPQLFRAAVLEVPFLDVLNTLMDPTSALCTNYSFKEFGDPEIQSSFEYILKYSPYENIPEGACCPLMLVKAGYNDSRIGVWEAAKWVAKLRDTACPSCSSAVILRTSMDEGHTAWDGRFVSRRKKAYEYAFLIKNTTNLQD